MTHNIDAATLQLSAPGGYTPPDPTKVKPVNGDPADELVETAREAVSSESTLRVQHHAAKEHRDATIRRLYFEREMTPPQIMRLLTDQHDPDKGLSLSNIRAIVDKRERINGSR